MPPVNIYDIARQAGVSITAVSFAFNDPERLSKATLDRILRVADELGYAPHPVARSLSMGRTGVIGVLLPQDIATVLENPFYNQLLQGIGKVCLEEEGNILLSSPIRGSLLSAIDRAMVDGFIVIGLGEQDPAMQLLQRRGTPFVLIDSEPLDGVPCVNIDDRGGAKAVMQYVLDQGHRFIAIVGFESGESSDWQKWRGTMRWRMDGYREALTTVGLSPDSPEVSILECESSLEGGKKAFHRLWLMEQKPTVVVAMSDVIALGVMKAAQERGVSVPDHLSVVGYDDVVDAGMAIPALTTVHQLGVEKGEQAAGLLIRRLRGDMVNEHITLPTRLMVRASVAALPLV